MSRKYFEVFPNTAYNGFTCKNIMAGVSLTNRYVNTPYIFYRFDVDRDERADQIAESYYNDPYLTWLIYYSNGIRDPYYDWFLTYEDFNSHMADKYSSIETAQKNIEYFRTNWYSDERVLSPTQYTAFFGEYKEPHSNYWNPNFDENSGRVISYSRKKLDRFQNTNKLVCVAVSNNSTSNTSKLTANDIIDIKTGATTVGTAKVEKANTTVVHLKHVLGNIANTYNLHIDNTNTYCTISSYSSEFDLTQTAWTKLNISEEEYIYWEPVYSYDIEDEINTLKRNIRLIDPTTAIRIHDRLEEELKN